MENLHENNTKEGVKLLKPKNDIVFQSLFNQNKESLGWLISVKGIRHALEEHNV